jgi:hypothetical protein
VMGRHRQDAKRWEEVAELVAFAALAIPTSLLLFLSEWLWRDEWAAVVLLTALTVPPGVALWLIERRVRRRRQAG